MTNKYDSLHEFKQNFYSASLKLSPLSMGHWPKVKIRGHYGLWPTLNSYKLCIYFYCLIIRYPRRCFGICSVTIFICECNKLINKIHLVSDKNFIAHVASSLVTMRKKSKKFQWGRIIWNLSKRKVRFMIAWWLYGPDG